MKAPDGAGSDSGVSTDISAAPHLCRRGGGLSPPGGIGDKQEKRIGKFVQTANMPILSVGVCLDMHGPPGASAPTASRETLCSARTVRRDSMHTPLASSAYSHFPLYSPIFPRNDLVRSNPWFSTFSLLVNPTDSVLSEAAFSRRKNSSKDR